ncbi:MAG: SPOR domain-containing protein [bacterium]
MTDLHRTAAPVLLIPLLLAALAAAGCAGGAPRFTDRPGGEEGGYAPGTQQTDLEGELLAPPPERSAEDAVRDRPEAVLPLMGLGGAPPPTRPVELPPAPDTTRVRAETVPLPAGPRKEYQVQVAITPSAEEAEEFVERLEPLLPEEEVFVVFTRPYYRIRVGHKDRREEADDLLERLQGLGYTGAMIIPVTISPPGEDR